MTFFEKLKFSLGPYLSYHRIYTASKLASKNLNKYYWLDGNSYNIIKGKWKVENGISLGLYTHSLDAPLVKRVNITGLSEYGFALAELDREGEQHVIINFIAENILTGNDDKGFEYSYWDPGFSHDDQCYFIDGMGQGQMLSLITRYNVMFPDKANNDVLKRISNSYLVDFDHPNGFVSKENGQVIFEEYSRPRPCTHVLNGWIYALTGLFDYIGYCDKVGLQDALLTEKRTLLAQTIDTLESALGRYDLGYWSTYDQPNVKENICSIHYHVAHIAQLKSLYIMTGRKSFLEYSNRFLAQYRNPVFRMLALFNKIFASNLVKKGRLFRVK